MADGVVVGSPIPTMKVCALLTAEIGIFPEFRDLAAWYLEKAPSLKLWGRPAILKASQKDTLLMQDFYEVLKALG